jgi:hypothetical protein
MGVGLSGRIVIEVDPDTKRELYSALARDGLTLKEWFLRSVQAHLLNRVQLQLTLNSKARMRPAGGQRYQPKSNRKGKIA